MSLKFLLIFAAISYVIASKSQLSLDNPRIQQLRRRIGDIKNQLKENSAETKSEQLTRIVIKIPFQDTQRGAIIEDNFLCELCNTVLEDFLELRRIKNETDEYLKTLALELCVGFEIQNEEVCFGVIKLYAPVVLFIVDHRPNLTANTVCKLLLNRGVCKKSYDDDNLEFSINIFSNKTENAEQKVPHQSTNDLIILHITDIHVDLKYKQNSLADCDKFVCCRDVDDGSEEDSKTPAGPWGDYRSCDTPWQAVIDAFQHIKLQHNKIDAIYFTGDIVDHVLWDTSIDGMKESIKKVYDLMTEIFGEIPIFPILGNHEAQNVFAPSNIPENSLSIQWLYEHVSKLWTEIIRDTGFVSKNGYYTILIRPGLRLIAMNSNLCFIYNWWILYEVNNIREQFQWLADTLLEAERNDEKVHILSHFPNGIDEYHQPCSREYQRTVERFHNTIVAQFNGHTELFGYNIFYDGNNKENAINVAWNGGSLATYSGVNRNYVVYNVDSISFEVTDVESWIYNLTEANQNPHLPPQWLRQFSFRDSFNLTDLSPTTMDDFTMSLSLNGTSIQQLWRMTIKDSDFVIVDECSNEHLLEMLCEILITDNSDTRKCEQLNSSIK